MSKRTTPRTANGGAPTRVTTERTSMQEALVRSSEELERVTDRLSLAVAFVDSKQRYWFTNRAYDEWVQRPHGEIAGRHIREILGEPVYEKIRGHIEAALSGKQVTFEARLPYRQKGLRDVTVVYSPYLGERERVEGFVAFITGVTTRSREDEALRLIAEGTRSAIGDEFFRALVKNLAHVLQLRFAFIAEMIDPEGGRLRLVSFWTGADYGETFEYSTEGTPCELVVGKNLAYFPAGVQELFAGDLWLREMGIESYLAIPLFDSSGNPLGHLGVMHDERMHDDPAAEPILRIFAARAGAELERRREEQLLRESERKFRLLAENIAEVFWLLDPKDDQVLYVSPAYEKLWGRTCESLYEDPRSWLASVHPDDLERVSAALEKEVETGRFDEEFQIIRSDGSSRWVWDRSFAVKDESGQVDLVVGVAADISERKRAEEALREARERLEAKVERSLLRRNPYGLTLRELTILHYVSVGKADKQIADELSISPPTASKHVANILHKMKARSRTEVGGRALREGLLE